ncbi:MAG: GMC family oxidoreductase N-terminal domain-containing protein [Reyranella sp.]|nr:GMC family oxidoreductase N-terminal domain-containing protein [Reyranella sp.]
MDEFDFVVVGAGSSGAPIVDRLTASGRHSVLLLEAGPDDSTNKWLSIPLGFAKTFLDPEVNWKFATEPEAELGGRRVYWPRGKVVGGSSAINGMVYVRGMASDYDRWRQMGNQGWSFDDCLPYFKRLESYPGGESELHGGDGPVKITQDEYRNELSEAFLAACAEVGVPSISDFNGRGEEGSGLYHATISDGRRCSTGKAYLAPARRRPNCHVVTDALVERIEVADGRATGVTYRKDGRQVTARARCEIVLSAGAVGSPQLLQLSGIGPGALLGGLGIPVVRDLAGVGENLQDHWGVRSTYRTWWRLTVNDDINLFHRRMSAAIEYALLRTGPLTASPAFAGAFVRLMPQSDEPDTQLHFFPWSTDRIDRGPHPFSGFTILANQSRPESRGHVRIASKDPAAAPRIVANYLSTDFDRKATVSAIKFVRLLARTTALSRIITEELLPGVEAWSDKDFLEHARKDGQSAYHPVGTCRMGSDPAAVVDPRLRVNGIAGLRVADASIMPALVSGNTNAACMMIGEKAADLILADAR